MGPMRHQFHQHVPKNLFLQEDVSIYSQKLSETTNKHFSKHEPFLVETIIQAC
jgi:hypothetical protein